MAKNIEHIQHVKSNVVLEGRPKLPTADVLIEGEIAVNYADGYETLSVKSSSGNIVTFSSDKYYTEQKLGSGFTGNNVTVTDVIAENERIISNTLNYFDEKKLDASAYTPTDLSNYYTKSETSGASQIASALNNYYTKSQTSGASQIATAFNNYYTKSETSGKTELSTAFGNKTNTSDFTAHTADTSAHGVTNYPDTAIYSSTDKKIYFKHGSTTLTNMTIDATDFIKDGMISGVTLEAKSGTTYLVIKWNTDAGIQTTELNIGDLFEADNYYTKTDIDDKLGSGFTVSSVTDVIESDERVISAALNDLESRKMDASAYTPTDLSNYYTKSETSGASQIASALNGKTDTATTTALDNVVTAHTANTNIHLTTTEKGQLHTHNNKTYLDGITGTVGTMAYQNASSYSSATQVNTALGNKVDKTEYATFSAATNASIDDLSGQSETIAAALNYLNDNKLDASAYTPTDLSNYYTKDETSGKTEISNALGAKVNTATFTAHTADTSIHFTTGIVQTLINNSISGKVNVSDVVSAITVDNSGSTNPVSTVAILNVVKENEEIVSFALNDLDDRKLDASAMTEVESAVSDLESIVGSGYTNTTITEVIENMDTAIAAALTDLDDKIGDIESILATI